MNFNKQKNSTAKLKKLSLNTGDFGFTEILSREELKQMMGGTDSGSDTGSGSGSGLEGGYWVTVIDENGNEILKWVPDVP